MDLSNNAIGILDSGVGGFSVLLELRKKLPQSTIHYIGDSAWCPYGNKPAEQIQKRAFAVCEELIKMGANTIVVACNSATIHAVEALRARYPLTFVGMEPAVKPASKITRTGTIGVLATEASIAGEKFHQLVDTHIYPNDLKVITQPCPEFVTLVEEGTLSGPSVESAVAKYALPMVEAGADTLVLGCTHYPFLSPTIRKIVGDSVQLIDTGEAVARRTASLNPYHSGTGGISIHTTGNLACLERLFPILCPELSASLHNIDITT
ncbi:glutamate racemase [Rubritalea tangerina]|uniref:Glutamate racemase n=1 Tax=Rubritalea tangerina TaxID=430798 RepID=A0ABW4Z7T6_9BACT